MSTDDDLISGKDLAAQLGVTASAISHGVKRGRLRHADPERRLFSRTQAKADWEATRRRGRRVDTRGGAKASTDAAALMAMRLEREGAQAKLATLALREREGRLIDRDHVTHVLRSAGAACRQIFERMPGGWAHQLLALPTTHAVRGVLVTLCAEAMAELYAALDRSEAKLPAASAGEEK